MRDTSKVTRRSFVKTAASATVVLGTASRSAQARILGANDRINLAVIGVGGLMIRGWRASGDARMRERIRDTIAAEVSERPMSSTELDAYLARLEQRARAQGKVTALEVEPGFAAILRSNLPDSDRRLTEFGQRQARLSAELDGRPVE